MQQHVYSRMAWLNAPCPPADEMARIRVVSRGLVSRAPPPMLLEEGLGYWITEAKKRIADSFDAVVIFEGPEGQGKSTCALRFCMAIDPTFNVDTMHDRICYTADDVLSCFETLQPGQALLFDEAARELGSTDTFSVTQKALVQALMLVREKRIVTVMAIPDITRLAKAIRARRSWLLIRVVQRGIALVYVRDDEMKFKIAKDDELGFVQPETAEMLTWDRYPPNGKVWMRYSEVKSMKLAQYLRETKALLRKKGKGVREDSNEGDGENVQRVPGDGENVQRVPGDFGKLLVEPKSGEHESPSVLSGEPPLNDDEEALAARIYELDKTMDRKDIAKFIGVSEYRMRRVAPRGHHANPAGKSNLDRGRKTMKYRVLNVRTDGLGRQWVEPKVRQPRHERHPSAGAAP